MGLHQVVIGEELVRTRLALVCGGSRPAVPAIAGLDEVDHRAVSRSASSTAGRGALLSLA